MFRFELTDRDGDARRGVFTTPHGAVDTPVFMPVGTAGSIKGVTPDQLRATGTRMILANTYHLQLRPTAEVVRDLGGLHRFMAWDGPILTDSGGYQVFSLGAIRKVTDEGVEFRSHIDGTPLRLDPQTAIDVQHKLGADVIMVLDECPPLPASEEAIRRAVDRTIRWAAACKAHHAATSHAQRGVAQPLHADNSGAQPPPAGQPGSPLAAVSHDAPPQALFGIVQGGLDLSERKRCAAALIDIGFDGYAIGGLSVGETHEQMVAVLGPTAAELPADRPRYLMGVGTPRDLFEAVRAGVDMFDCVLPTRNGRNSHAFTAAGVLRMRNERYRRDEGPFEPGCDCEACQHFSRGYIRHLFHAGEMLGPTLTSIHNLRFYQRFMARIRELIPEGRLVKMLEEYPIAAGIDAVTGTEDTP